MLLLAQDEYMSNCATILLIATRSDRPTMRHPYLHRFDGWMPADIPKGGLAALPRSSHGESA